MFRSRTRMLLLAGGLITGLAAVGGVVALRSQNDAPTAIVPREAANLYQTAAANRTSTDSQIETLQSYLTKRTDEPSLLARLGGAYLQKARETGDPTWYAK